MESKQFGLHFGALSEPLAKQISDQGLKFSEQKVRNFQSLADALTLLRIHDIIIDSQIGKMNERLYKKIVKHVVQANKLTIKK